MNITHQTTAQPRYDLQALSPRTMITLRPATFRFTTFNTKTLLMSWRSLTILVLVLILSSIPNGFAFENSSLQGKLMVGYQGWFGCPNDFDGNKEWHHWFTGQPSLQTLRVDLIPFLEEFNPRDLCDTGLPRVDGKGTVKLFSSQNPAIVNAHFGWMRQHQIDGVAVARFVVAILPPPALKNRFDNVLRNIMAAAEAHKRFFYIIYDVSGANPETVTNDIRQDWRYLVQDLKVTEHPYYQHHKGKPVVQLWGFGFKTRPGEPAEVISLQNDLKRGVAGLPPVTLIGGVPTFWRSLTRDAKPEPLWATVYRNYDIISPWSVGRFADIVGADAFAGAQIAPDLEETRRQHQDYMPVIFPGFSWYNLQTNRKKPRSATLNSIPRQCGQFYWRQITNVLDLKATMLYSAMFDEVDEGTALFPTASRTNSLPAGAGMITLNQDGCSLPEDWYLRITGAAANALHQNKQPPRRLEEAVPKQPGH